VIPIWAASEVLIPDPDTAPEVFTIKTASQDYTFRAVDAANATEWVEALQERLKSLHGEIDAASGVAFVPKIPSDATIDDSENGDDDEENPLARPPKGTPTMEKVMHYLKLPFCLLFSYTIPNVKRPHLRRFFVISIFLVCVWLAGLVYVMVWCAERFADVIHIPPDIVGLAITGICASLPSLFGSLACAKQGAGVMAVANALGSNTTCILLGFGLPYFIRAVFIEGGKSFTVSSESVPLTVVVLLSALFIFLVGVIVCCLRLKRPAGIAYIVCFFLLLSTIVILSLAHVTIKI